MKQLRSPEEAKTFILDSIPLSEYFPFEIDQVNENSATCRFPMGEGKMGRHERPLNGPAIMTLVDVAAYSWLICSKDQGERAVTHSMQISFFDRPLKEDVHCEVSLEKARKRDFYFHAKVYQGKDHVIASGLVHYTIPKS